MTHVCPTTLLKALEDLSMLWDRKKLPRVAGFPQRHLQDSVGLRGVIVNLNVATHDRLNFIPGAAIPYDKLTDSTAAGIPLLVARVKNIETVFMAADHDIRLVSY